jgi:predicted esterase
VRFIIDNAETLGVDPSNIVLSGSSAGAMIALTAEWELVNRMPNASMLPEGFNFAGVMSFAGAIMSDRGTPSWDSQPCPHLMFHGTEDTLVKYTKTQALGIGIFGTSCLVDRFKKQGYPYWAVRLEGHGHDVAACMIYLWKWEKDWLEQNVILGHGRTSDEIVNDPSIPAWWKGSLKVYDGELE